MKRWLALLLCALALGCSERRSDLTSLAWEELPPLPDPIGFAGPFAGVSNDALIVAGGANFPQGPPWEGHGKVWHDRIFVLERGGVWHTCSETLPKPTGYGASVTWKDRVVCIGGGDAETHSRDVFTLRWVDRKIVREKLPPLPEPAAFLSAALAGDVVYAVGGTDAPGAKTARRECYALDLGDAQAGWRTIPACPGPGRMLSVAGASDGKLFVFGGIELRAGDRVLPYRSDCHRFDPRTSVWQPIRVAPVPIAAGPTPAVTAGSSHLIVFGGDDGSRVGTDIREHPGFAGPIFAYHTVTNTWRRIGEVPDPAPVTTTAVSWSDRMILPTGEVRPGVRTNRVLAAGRGATTSGFGTTDYVVLATYLLALVGMGFYFSRRERGTNDFFLAGRRIPAWAAGLSIFGTQLSAITFLAMPAKTFATDWLYFPMSCGIVLMGPIVIYLYLPFFRRLDVTSAYEYLEKRFSLALRLLGSLSFVVFQLGRMSVVVFLPALALGAVTGMPVESCILVMGLLATAYTVLGGIEAVIWTDVLQVFVLLGGAIVADIVMDTRLSGDAFELADAFGKTRWAAPGWDLTGPSLFVIALGAIFNNLVPYTTDQAVVQRYLTTRDERSAARAVWIGTILALPASVLFFGIGTSLFAYYWTYPSALDAFGHNDQIFAWFVVHELPAGLSGLVIAGVFAAAMSSLDSSMNSIATAVTTDFVRRLRPLRDDASYLRFARVLTIVLGGIGTGGALLMAQLDVQSLWDAFLGILGLFGGTLAGLFALGIFTRRVGPAAALAGTALSFATLAYVKFATEVSGLAYAAIGCVSCFVYGLLVSLILPDRRALDGLTIWTSKRS